MDRNNKHDDESQHGKVFFFFLQAAGSGETNIEEYSKNESPPLLC